MRRAADSDDHEWDIEIAAEEVCATTHPVDDAVDPDQHGDADEVMPVQQVADGVERGGAVDTAVAADVHGQLDLVVTVRQRHHRVTSQKPGALQGDQPTAGHLGDHVGQVADRRCGVDSFDRHRGILG